MTIGIFTTCTRPHERGDMFNEAITCYKDLADTVYVNDKDWPQEFRWDHIGKSFQIGYERTYADWVIHCDLDFIFHENDFTKIRQALERHKHSPAVSFYKWQFILPDRYNLKSRLVVAVNKELMGDRIRFDSGGDLCQPSLDGRELKPDDVPQAGVPIYNYEKLLKTESQVKDDVGRMARAWQRQFGEYKLGGPDDNSSYQEWLKMVKGRFQKPQRKIKLQEHPRYVQETIKNLTDEQWGYSGFGMEVNSYV